MKQLKDAGEPPTTTMLRGPRVILAEAAETHATTTATTHHLYKTHLDLLSLPNPKLLKAEAAGRRDGHRWGRPAGRVGSEF